jgi:chromosome segregation ATPase
MQEKKAEYCQIKEATASKISVASTTSEFIESKVSELSSELDYLQTYKTSLRALFDESTEDKVSVKKELDIIKKRILPVEDELVTLKRQKKIIQEDIDDILPQHDTIKEAYSSLIVNKVMSASRHSERNFDQKAFRNKVCEYYKAIQTIDGPKTRTRKWCHVLGRWLEGSTVKAAHLVPKSLMSEELSYLFGVGEALLSDPRNGKLNMNTLKYTANIRSPQGSHFTRRLN